MLNETITRVQFAIAQARLQTADVSLQPDLVRMIDAALPRAAARTTLSIPEARKVLNALREERERQAADFQRQPALARGH